MAVNYKIFTDGSSRGNPGPGGWGAIVVSVADISNKNLDSGEDVAVASVTELGGGEKQTTNNRMELMAAAKVLEYISSKTRFRLSDVVSPDSTIDIYTDSSYLINGITKWVHGWKENAWKTKTKNDVLNKALWQEIDYLVNTGSSHGAKKSRPFDIKWHHIGGHVGIVGNERCDEIATAFADSLMKDVSRSTKETEYKIELYDGSLSGYREMMFGRDILDLSHDEFMTKAKRSSSTRSRTKAYSYVSKVDGVIETHKTWQECEGRVKGKHGARFKKALDISEESDIVSDFSR